MNPRFSPHFEWLILTIIATTLATCCVKDWNPKELEGKRGDIVQMEDTETNDKNLF